MLSDYFKSASESSINRAKSIVNQAAATTNNKQ